MKTLTEIERDVVAERLEICKSKVQAAETLGITSKTVFNLIERHNLKVKRFSSPVDLKTLKTLDQVEKESIIERLDKFDHNKLMTSKSLGINPSTLRNLIRKYAIITRISKSEMFGLLPSEEYSSNKEKRLMADPEYTGYNDPTPEERDKWYNKDFF